MAGMFHRTSVNQSDPAIMDHSHSDVVPPVEKPYAMDVNSMIDPPPQRNMGTGLPSRINSYVANSRLGRYFELESRNTTFTTELRAGTVCFLTVCYILAVNSSILAQSGGPCTSNDCTGPMKGEFDCRFTGDPGWDNCIAETQHSLIAATAIASMICCFFMGVLANMPLALAPGMGINAYFTFTVVGYYGTGRLPYKGALAAVFVEGWIFILLSATGARQKLVALVPKYIMFSTAAGIGMFIAFIGFQASDGLGVVVFDGATLVTMGGCPLEDRTYAYMFPSDVQFSDVCGANETLSLGAGSDSYSCTGNVMRSPTMWLGICGGIVMVVCMARGVPAAILFGVLFTTFISWIPNTAATYFGDNSQVLGGAARYSYFLKGVAVPDVSKTAGKLDFSYLGQGQTWAILITFLYLDFLDATSTMMTMARLMGETIPGFINDRGVWPKQMQTMCMDGASIVLASLLGSSPLTVMAESAVGVREGGRTGITAITIAFGFGISMFLAPLFGNIPGYATGPALILVGALMIGHVRDIEWDSVRVAVPSFITIIMMPMTYTISYGVMWGLVAALILWVANTLLDLICVACGWGSKTYRIVYLEAFGNFYLAFDNEHVLISEVPGYVPSTILARTTSKNHGVQDPVQLVATLEKALAAAQLEVQAQLRDGAGLKGLEL